MANKVGKEAGIAGNAVAEFCQQMIDKKGIPQIEFEVGEGDTKFKIVIEKV